MDEVQDTNQIAKNTDTQIPEILCQKCHSLNAPNSQDCVKCGVKLCIPKGVKNEVLDTQRISTNAVASSTY